MSPTISVTVTVTVTFTVTVTVRDFFLIFSSRNGIEKECIDPDGGGEAGSRANGVSIS